MIIATLETKPLEGERSDGAREVGTFSLSVQLESHILEGSADPRKVILRTVATYLASAILDTGVPSNMWALFFPEKVCREFNLNPRYDLENYHDLLS